MYFIKVIQIKLIYDMLDDTKRKSQVVNQRRADKDRNKDITSSESKKGRQRPN